MEIYLLKQDLNNDWDTYDSVVVIAENETEARKIHPRGNDTHIVGDKWMRTYSDGTKLETTFHGWVDVSDIDKIQVTHIGTANDQQEKGVLLASFNAG